MSPSQSEEPQSVAACGCDFDQQTTQIAEALVSLTVASRKLIMRDLVSQERRTTK